MTSGLISDEEIMKIPIRECGEPLVELGALHTGVVIALEKVSRSEQKLGAGKCFVREGVAKRLAKAQSLLANGMRLKIVDGYRPMAAQVKIYDQFLNELKQKRPNLTDEAARIETDRWIANPKIVPFHTTGGALDLTVVDSADAELDMGTTINSPNEESETGSTRISIAARKNREVLSRVMEAAGFVNYPLEWWHWSFGDRYWAAVNRKESIYGPIQMGLPRFELG